MAPLPPRPAPPAPAPETPQPARARVIARRALAWGRRWWILTVVLVALAGLSGTLLVRDLRAPAPLTQAEIDKAAAKVVDKALAEAARAPSAASTAYAQVAASLVIIETVGGGGDPAAQGLGTGVIVSQEGAILTANHVVSGGVAITVTFADGTRAPARVQSAQPENDIAVLVADQLPQVVVPAVLGGGVRVGDPVYAVGHPLGLTASLSSGVVSATGRTIEAEGLKLADLIQFDAAVNPGNSGGPLLNSAGQVVGIVTALANPSKQPFFVGIGFAVPIATAGGAAGGPSI